ncbi:MAG: ATP-binding protein [Bacteroidales bacterium]|nr:ATP-binding protein [Bacteroidales bacterium]
METPFVFGKIAADKNFTDRKGETDQLVSNFLSQTNTILISPRRWGKSSLVARAAEISTKRTDNIRFCFVDLYNIRTEEEFYQSLARKVLLTTSTKVENIMDNARKFMGRLIPNLSFSPDSISDFSLGLDWQEVKKHPDDILNMSENIAEEKNLKIIVCIDEFQNLSTFSDPLSMQKKLRSHWQKHKRTSYCLYGSKRHMLMDVFASPSMPFYKFGDLIFLQKIAEKDWVKFILGRFSETGKEISENEAMLITKLVECHPYYVQQLAQQSWLRSMDQCSTDIVIESHENLMLQLSMLFQSITEELTNKQINFLKALLDEVPQLSASDILRSYKLGTSANVLRMKQALSNKEIIDIQGDNVSFQDPVFKHWLKKYYFRI